MNQINISINCADPSKRDRKKNDKQRVKSERKSTLKRYSLVIHMDALVRIRKGRKAE